jgi:hypothetical protein
MKFQPTYSVLKDNLIVGWTTQNYLPGYTLHITTKKAIKGLPQFRLGSKGVYEVK